ncbi:MAG: MlaD family protein [Candidatus Xenobiia bacterium LiM19]
MEISPAAKVGMIVVLALVMLGLVMSQLSYWKHRDVGVHYYVIFKNVAGLQIGSAVRKAGVYIGKVTSIQIIGSDEPDKALHKYRNQVKVTISVSSSKEELTKESLYVINSTFMGDKWLEINPRDGKKMVENEVAMGTSPTTLDDLIVQGKAALAELQTAVNNVNNLVGDANVQRDLKSSVANFNRITANLKKASNRIDGTVEKLSDRMVAVVDQANDVLKNVNVEVAKVSSDISGFTSTLNRIAVKNEGNINDMVANLQQTSHNLNASMKAIKDLVTADKFSGDILKTLEKLSNASEQVEGIANDVRTITSDPEIREDIKATVREARETVAGAKDLIKRVRSTLGIGDGEKLKLLNLDTNVEWNGVSNRTTGNANLWLLPKSRHTLKMGVEDIGNRNLVNFQYGRTSKSFRPRVGVIRSAVGLGADAFLGKNVELNLDAYNPNDVNVDVLGRIYLGNDYYIQGGVRDAFDTKQGVIGVGKKF